MSNDKNNEFHGEILTPEIKRKGVYELGKVNRVPPSVGIFDNPTRCFVVNQEWWSHIAGMVHLLADVVSWKDAEDDDYFAIQEILRFMQGVECMDFALRQNPADNCILQQTLDGGTTWTDVFDFSLCATIQDNSTSVNIQNSVTYVQPTFQTIYNNFITNYTGNPESVYPDLAESAGDNSTLAAAYCNALWELVTTACSAAVSFYTETINAQQGQVNVGLGIAAFVLTAISLAAAIPTAGASLVGLAPAAGLWAAGIGVGAVFGNALLDYWQQHTIDQFQDTEAMEEVVCYLTEEVPPGDNSLASLQSALVGHGLTGNAAVIADFLAILLSEDSTYAAFLEKWNNNKQFADAGIDLHCPCEEPYALLIIDFQSQWGSYQVGGFTGSIMSGEFVSGIGWHITDIGGGNGLMQFGIAVEPTWVFVACAYKSTNPAGARVVQLRPNPGSQTDAYQMNFTNGTEWAYSNFVAVPRTGFNEFAIRFADPMSDDTYITQIAFKFTFASAPLNAIQTDDPNFY